MYKEYSDICAQILHFSVQDLTKFIPPKTSNSSEHSEW
jgi:hypothetical protein